MIFKKSFFEGKVQSMHDFTVRKATLSDAFDIYNINKDSLGYDYAFEKQKRKIEVVLQDPTQALFVASADEKVVGYIHLVNYDAVYADNYKNVLGLAVLQAYKRRGIGTALLQTAEKWAKENGAFGVRLCSSAEREEAHRFYSSVGYTEKKVQKNFRKVFSCAEQNGLR